MTPAQCHVLSCSPCRRRSSAVPFLHIVAPSRSVPLPSVHVPAARPPGAAGPFLRAYRACAPAPARPRLAPARFAHLIAREAEGARPLRKRGDSRKTPALCHDMSCSPCRRQSSAVPFLHIVPSPSVPFPSVRAAARLPVAAGPFLRAYPACAPAPVRARLAPARFAHLIARARRRAHLARPFPPGLFSGPSHIPAQKSRKAAPEAASLHPSYTTFSPVKPPGGRNMKFFLFSCRKTDEQRKSLPIYPVAHTSGR